MTMLFEEIIRDQNNIGFKIDRLANPEHTPDYAMTHDNYMSLIAAAHYWTQKLYASNTVMANQVQSFKNQCEMDRQKIEIKTRVFVKNAMKDRRGSGIRQEFQPHLKVVRKDNNVRDTQPPTMDI